MRERWREGASSGLGLAEHGNETCAPAKGHTLRKHANSGFGGSQKVLVNYSYPVSLKAGVKDGAA